LQPSAKDSPTGGRACSVAKARWSTGDIVKLVLVELTEVVRHARGEFGSLRESKERIGGLQFWTPRLFLWLLLLTMEYTIIMMIIREVHNTRFEKFQRL